MKRSLLISICSLLVPCLWLYAQAPSAISYQAVLRNSQNDLLVQKNVGVRISILKDTPDGQVSYAETQTVKTNDNGVVDLVIGRGNPVVGSSLHAIDWSSGNYYLKTEMDLEGGTDYRLTGTGQLLSVPFALYAATTGSQEKQVLSLSNDTIYLTDGGYVKLPESKGFSGNYDDLTNKPQGASNGDILYWQNGAWQTLPIGTDGQVLSINNGRLTWETIAGISVSRYKEGEVYYENNIPVGVIYEISTSGFYGKMIALQDSLLAWSTDTTVTVGALDYANGVLNMQSVAAVADWETDYPAFDYCRSLGSDWFLPARDELKAIYGMKTDLNAALSTIGVNALREDAHWSSTEQGSVYSWAISLADTAEWKGTPFDSKKTEEYVARAVKRLNWEEINNKPVAPSASYSVGDIYYGLGNVPLGVVYEVSVNGLHGKMIALNETELAWSGLTEFVEIGTSDRANGANNLEVIGLIANWETDYPAFKYACLNGPEWYLPARDELETIFSRKHILNPVLSKMSATLLKDAFYWSSTERGRNYSFGVAMGDYSVTFYVDDEVVIEDVTGGTVYEEYKSEVQKVRAIRYF